MPTLAYFAPCGHVEIWNVELESMKPLLGSFGKTNYQHPAFFSTQKHLTLLWDSHVKFLGRHVGRSGTRGHRLLGAREAAFHCVGGHLVKNTWKTTFDFQAASLMSKDLNLLNDLKLKRQNEMHACKQAIC